MKRLLVALLAFALILTTPAAFANDEAQSFTDFHNQFTKAYGYSLSPQSGEIANGLLLSDADGRIAVEYVFDESGARVQSVTVRCRALDAVKTRANLSATAFGCLVLMDDEIESFTSWLAKQSALLLPGAEIEETFQAENASVVLRGHNDSGDFLYEVVIERLINAVPAATPTPAPVQTPAAATPAPTTAPTPVPAGPFNLNYFDADTYVGEGQLLRLLQSMSINLGDGLYVHSPFVLVRDDLNAAWVCLPLTSPTAATEAKFAFEDVTYVKNVHAMQDDMYYVSFDGSTALGEETVYGQDICARIAALDDTEACVLTLTFANGRQFSARIPGAVWREARFMDVAAVYALATGKNDCAAEQIPGLTDFSFSAQ